MKKQKIQSVYRASGKFVLDFHIPGIQFLYPSLLIFFVPGCCRLADFLLGTRGKQQASSKPIRI
jgi:hypothetical protein